MVLLLIFNNSELFQVIIGYRGTKLIELLQNSKHAKGAYTEYTIGGGAKDLLNAMIFIFCFCFLVCDTLLLQSTRVGSHPLLMVDIKVYCSQQEWVHTLC